MSELWHSVPFVTHGTSYLVGFGDTRERRGTDLRCLDCEISVPLVAHGNLLICGYPSG
jgi:hypothetical protein